MVYEAEALEVDMKALEFVVFCFGLPPDGVEHPLLILQIARPDTVVQRPQLVEGAAVGALGVRCYRYRKHYE
jgi:hypothetical protein